MYAQDGKSPPHLGEKGGKREDHGQGKNEYEKARPRFRLTSKSRDVGTKTEKAFVEGTVMKRRCRSGGNQPRKSIPDHLNANEKIKRCGIKKAIISKAGGLVRKRRH